jgi:hypothetical protein
MEGTSVEARRNPVAEFFTSPLHGPQAAPMRLIGDWLSAAGVVLYCVSVFALPWITVGIKDVFGIGQALGVGTPEKSYGLFVSPWAWALVGVLVLILGGMWFVQTHGAIVLASGVFCLAFNVVFYVGAWKKINGIIGDIVNLARSIPFIGEFLGQAISNVVKSMLSVHVAAGFWLFVPAGLLLIAGGALRLARGPGSRAAEVAQ